MNDRDNHLSDSARYTLGPECVDDALELDLRKDLPADPPPTVYTVTVQELDALGNVVTTDTQQRDTYSDALVFAIDTANRAYHQGRATRWTIESDQEETRSGFYPAPFAPPTQSGPDPAPSSPLTTEETAFLTRLLLEKPAALQDTLRIYLILASYAMKPNRHFGRSLVPDLLAQALEGKPSRFEAACIDTACAHRFVPAIENPTEIARCPKCGKLAWVWDATSIRP
jgi:hypothetical protein